MEEERKLLSNLILELRRGTLVLSVLSQLKEKKYGYALVQSLEQKGVSIDSNTLYPLLRRLEKQGILQSEWDMKEVKPRKYYSRTEKGEWIYQELKNQWEQMSAHMAGLWGEDGEKDT